MRKSLFLLLSVLFLVGQAFAQSRTIKGKVTSADDGQPVIGAAVIVKGTTTGVTTSPDGSYSIQVPEGATLVFRSVGMKEQQMAVKGSNNIDIVLQQDVTSLTETVVTANAIRRDKRSLGYAAPTVNAEEIGQAHSTSALNALSGKVAGVNITSTANAPGSSSRIVLRGGSSISGNNQALLVIDGVPVDNTSITGNNDSRTGGTDARSSVDFGNRGNDINPDDIASMSILKGPAAAALYGSRASNGAIIITTKSGKKGAKKNEVTVSTTGTFSNVLKLPDYQNDYGQGGGMQPDFRENFSWGPKFDGQTKPWGQEINGVRQEKPYVAQKDNVKNFFDLGKAIDNNVALSGGGEKTAYYLALSSLNSDGVMPGNSDKYNRYGVRFNGSADLSNKFYTSVSINYNKIKSNMIQGGQGPGSVFDNVIQTPRDIPVDKIGDLNNPYNSYGGIRNAAGQEVYGYYGAYTASPYYLLQNYRNENDVDRVFGNFTIGYKPLPWLNITERLGADVYADRRRLKYPKYNLLPIDEAYYNSGGDLQTHSEVGQYEEDNYNLSEITHDLMITAKKDFSKDFSASLMVGNNIRQRTFTTSEVSTNRSAGLVVPGWYNLDNSNGPVYTFDEYTSRRLIGLYGQLSLAYRNMLFLDATARNDWSSTLPVNNRSFFYPSVSGSWVFTELLNGTSFSRILNYGKLRASWAQVGNDANPYLLNTYFVKTDITSGFGSTTFPFNGVPGLTQDSRIGNPNLKPEITTAYEVGTELNFLDNRISVDFSYYRNKSKDQILSIPISEVTGFRSKVINAGAVENKGIELGLRGTPIRTTYGLTVELYGTYTKNTNKVLDLNIEGVSQVSLGGLSGMAIVAAEGRPYGTFYAQDLQRDDQGHVIVSKNNGAPLLTPGSVYLGSYNPKYQASWGTNITYKGFSLNVLFDTKQGGKFFSRTKDITEFNGTAATTAVGGRDPRVWANSVYDDGTGKLVPNTDVKYDPYFYYTEVIPSGQNVIDASYVKLRQASLTYRLPKSLLNRTPFGDLSVGVFGNNLFIWTPKENGFADPEINSAGAGNLQGFDFTAQPSLRNFGVNVRASF
ncbi:SusC/RagA family TonB-linked outer membrane protein [Chitinophaga agrisoli]|uniref:SusC/RagA family TonB-linked outer membrane protein n=1 Tax=Chitinophaga agrisoli TaxID=2607653 RepID=A0A5B2W342_9BACT|nr:SusC/RagA family TonB-linked outer membrane protein [Chitinophaga agrisoli]KAA2244679.1 SusC/RagA family TonB-linked outer membrane protein [Chitinophaga agrisoli]